MLPRLSTYSPGAGGVEHTSYSSFAHQPRPCLACLCSLLYCSFKFVHCDLTLLKCKVLGKGTLKYPCSSSCTTKKSLVLPECCVNIFMTGGGSKRGGKERGVVKQSQSQSADSASHFSCWWLTLAKLFAHWLKIKVIKSRHFCLKRRGPANQGIKNPFYVPLISILGKILPESY